MIPTGPKHERETIIWFNEEGENASIWTASSVIYRRLMKRLGLEHLAVDGDRHAEFAFPVKWLTLPRKKVVTAAKKAQGARLAALGRRNTAR